jgi:hypothetical protein
MLFCRPKRSWNVWPVTEARRLSAAPGEGRGGEFRSLDMAGRAGAAWVSMVESCAGERLIGESSGGNVRLWRVV